LQGLTSVVVVNLDDGSIGTDTADSSSVTDVGNGWYRVSSTKTATGTGNAVFRNQLRTSSEVLYTGDGYSGFYIWGCQVEVGSFPTSYIKTTGSQVTRSKDLAKMNGDNLYDWYRENEGTLYLDYKVGEKTSAFRMASFGDGTQNNKMEFAIASSIGTGPYAFFVTNGITQVGSSGGYVYSSNTNQKVATAFKTNDVSWSNNGDATVNDTECIIPKINTFYIGSDVAEGAQPCSTIRKVAFYPIRLTNAELQDLTEA